MPLLVTNCGRYYMVSYSTIDNGLARTIKGSIYIRVNNPTLNRNVSKYNIHHIWDRVLFSAPELRINKHNGHVHRTSISGHVQTLPPSRHVHRTTKHFWHVQRTPPPENAHRTYQNPYKVLTFTFSSDLMKSSSCLDESLS